MLHHWYCQKIAKFAELDGLLFRITEASDPREGFDSTRVYVPPALRQKVIRSMHSGVFGAHRNATRKAFPESVCLSLTDNTIACAPCGWPMLAHALPPRQRRSAGHFSPHPPLP